MAQAKPTLRPFSGEKIPQALKAQKRWAPWKAKWNEKRGKYDKVPCSLDGVGLSTAKPERWHTYEAALKAYEANPQHFAGIGYLMTGPHGYVGIDLDNCISQNKIAPWAQTIIDKAATYTELSPSQTGVRMFLAGTTEVDWTNHDVGIEIYSGHEPRFLTVTGARLKTSVPHIADDTGLLAELHLAHASSKVEARVIDLNLPDIVDPSDLPQLSELDLSPRVRDFLTEGKFTGDRSRLLHNTGVELYANGLTDEQVLSILEANPHSMEVALDHRRQDHDRALMYLWVEHCQKARPKAESRILTADDFEDLSPPAAPGSASEDMFEDVSHIVDPPAAAPNKKFTFLQAAMYSAGMKPTTWLVRNVMPKAEVGVVFGASGAGKSFFVLDLCMAIARGERWRNRSTRRGNVAYIAAEGARGFKLRLDAYAEHHGIDLSETGFYALPAAPNVLDKAEVKDLIAALKELPPMDLIVIDTVAQVTPGADENSGQDMGRMLAHCKLIHKMTGAMVLLVGHTGKDESKGMRGWSGVKGALDVEIEVTRALHYRAATITKMKDGTGEGTELAFKLDVVTLGQEADEDGELHDITSCVLIETAVSAAGSAPPKGANEKILLGTIEDLINLAGAADIETAITAAADKKPPPDTGKKDQRRKDMRRALESLVAGGRLKVDGNLVLIA